MARRRRMVSLRIYWR